MTKKKVSQGAEILVHLTRQGPGNDESLLMLGVDSERIDRLQKIGFVTAGSYRLTGTAVGQVSMTLPASGVFADAYSALCESPWVEKGETDG